jgi:hypothetical protein
MKVEGGMVVVTGSGMPANTPVTVTYHKKPVGHTTVDANGSMSIRFPLPPWSRPRFHLVVTGQGGTFAAFNELPKPDVGYSVQNGLITVHGSNVAPGSVLSVSYGGVLLGQAQARPDGTFSATFVPRQLRPRFRLVVTGDQGVYGNFSHVQ